jgi:hypothetical protein
MRVTEDNAVHLPQFIRQFSFQPSGDPQPCIRPIRNPPISITRSSGRAPAPGGCPCCRIPPGLCVTKKIEHTQINQIPGMKHQIDVGKMLVNIFLEILVKTGKMRIGHHADPDCLLLHHRFRIISDKTKKLQALFAHALVVQKAI